MPIVEALEYLSQSIAQSQEKKRKLQVEDKMLLLGTKFVDDIDKATDIQSLSKAMLESNKVAFMLGVPQLAQQINNLGQLKQAELVQGKTEQLELQRSQALDSLYGNLEVLDDNGNYVQLKTMKEWQNAQNIDPKLRSEYYQGMVGRYKTEVMKVIDTTEGLDKPIHREYAVRNGKQVLTRELHRTDEGWDNILTENIKENFPTPAEIVDYTTKRQALEEQREYQLKDDYMRQNRAQPTQVEIMGNDGIPRVIPAYYIPAKNRYYSYGKDSKDITDQLISIKTWKPNKEEMVRTGDLTGLSKLLNTSAFNLMMQLKGEGKIDDEFLADYNFGNGPIASAVITDLITNKKIEKFTSESTYAYGMYEEYKENKKLYDEAVTSYKARTVTDKLKRSSLYDINNRPDSSNSVIQLQGIADTLQTFKNFKAPYLQKQ